jgi:hypothetical protein
MVAELRREQLDGGVEVLRSGQPNAHDSSTRATAPSFWRQADLGYALVPDVNEADLLALASRIAHP